MITLHGTPKSRALRVSWLLEELNLDWTFSYLDFSKGANRSPEYLALNPSGKMPVLQDGDLVITESAAICMYLAEKYGHGKLLPKAGTLESARHHEWISFIITEFEQPLWSMGKHKFALPAEVRIADMRNTAIWEFNKAAELAENKLPDSLYLLGDELTVADILLAQTLLWAQVFEQTLPPKLTAYFERMQQLPSLARAIDKAKASIPEET
ncbi:glutathione S-transferase family protein [Parashewanella curva]|uniref:Glutathione S-transferase family protein n=1 Tax=Parashewanella curva TaxID=2338552 RepID=A0A3L8PYA8_9GAMM|nr:glutathione S-transferase family protein [Parashewanella curva]RLV60245.1 glutathione S-transferase family protein [Parashewanella curva]